MHVTYRVNASQLDQNFLDALKATFQDKEIEIVVYDVDETAYLMASEANRKKLLKAIDNIKSRTNLIEVDIAAYKCDYED
jgi:antitoxin YefM